MSEAARDRQVARETVRPRSECPACNPGATPTPEAAGTLQETSTDGLLTAYAALTHRIHAAEQRALLSKARGSREGVIAATAAAETRREERDLIRAEILRRTGDL